MRRHQTGFTLVEIAIVLVIIGLLLGGILRGQELITNARVRSMIDQTNSLRAAFFGFQDRYRALPGDMPAAQASGLIATGLGGGGGNSQIDTNAERGFVWQHLASAGFISGSYNGAAVPANWTCSPATCPTNSYGGTVMLSFGAQSSGGAANAHELWTGSQVPVAVVAEIDRKVDDGIPQTGTFRSGLTLNAATCVTGALAASSYRAGVNGAQSNCGGVSRL